MCVDHSHLLAIRDQNLTVPPLHTHPQHQLCKCMCVCKREREIETACLPAERELLSKCHCGVSAQSVLCQSPTHQGLQYCVGTEPLRSEHHFVLVLLYLAHSQRGFPQPTPAPSVCPSLCSPSHPSSSLFRTLSSTHQHVCLSFCLYHEMVSLHRGTSAHVWSMNW